MLSSILEYYVKHFLYFLFQDHTAASASQNDEKKNCIQTANHFIPNFENHCSFVPNQTWGICENTSYIQRWIFYLVMEKWLTYLDSKGNWNFYIFCFHSFDKKNLLERFFRLLNKILKHCVREWTSGGVNYSGFEEWYILENLHLADFNLRTWQLLNGQFLLILIPNLWVNIEF